MKTTRQTVLVILSSAYASASRQDFRVDPTCVPFSEEVHEEILPHLCKFDEDAEYDPGFDCTDIPQECTRNTEAKATWASTKMYSLSQGTARDRCTGHLSRKVNFPECVFGEPVPEKRIGDFLDTAVEARELAEAILARNPSQCAATLALKVYDIFGAIYAGRMSEIAAHGLTENLSLRLSELRDAWNPETNDCDSEFAPKNGFATETEDEVAARHAMPNKFKFSRQVTKDCRVIRHYNGSSFAKEHGGGLNGCKVECDNEPGCNAFNMDLEYSITLKTPGCDLLECVDGAAKEDKYGFVGFTLRAAATEELEAPRN